MTVGTLDLARDPTARKRAPAAALRQTGDRPRPRRGSLSLRLGRAQVSRRHEQLRRGDPRSRRSGVRRRAERAVAHACHRAPELLQRRSRRAAARDRRDRAGRADPLLPLQLRRRGHRGRDQVRPRRHRTTQSRRGQARLSRPHPRRPGRDRRPEVPGAVRAAGATATHVSFNDVDALAAAVDDQTAAILLEPIQGEGGIWPASPEYLQAARDIAVRRAARCSSPTRSRPDSAPARPGRSTRQAWFPTSSSRQRPLPTDSQSV